MISIRIKTAPQGYSVKDCTTAGFSELSAKFLWAFKLTQEDLQSIWPMLESGPKQACLGELFKKKKAQLDLWLMVKARDPLVCIQFPVLI